MNKNKIWIGGQRENSAWEKFRKAKSTKKWYAFFPVAASGSHPFPCHLVYLPRLFVLFSLTKRNLVVIIGTWG